MQKPTSLSLWSKGHTEEKHKLCNYVPQSSAGPFAHAQAPANLGPQPMPAFSNQCENLYPCFSSSDAGEENPAMWPDTTPPGASSTTPGALSTSDQFPAGLSYLRTQIPAEVLSDYNIPNPSEPSLQELPTRSSALLRDCSSVTPADQSLLFPSIEPSAQHAPVLQCKWIGCRSTKPFRDENALVRHLKTVHISRNAYPCTEPKCRRTFGRKDHLMAHVRNIHQR